MTITCTGNDAEGHSYHFGMPPSNWMLPKGYMIKMDSYPSTSAEVVSSTVVEPWTGEGPPPVGVDFEWRYGGHAWKTGKALYIGSVYVILEANDGEQHYYVRDIQFRPIRTLEQIAADERKALIKEAIDLIAVSVAPYNESLPCSVAMRAVVEAMISANYRKQVTP